MRETMSKTKSWTKGWGKGAMKGNMKGDVTDMKGKLMREVANAFCNDWSLPS